MTKYASATAPFTVASALPRCKEAELSIALSANLYGSLQLDGDTRKIRLLELEPLVRKQHTTSPIRGKLRVVSLASSPKYAALSYVWGQQRRPENGPRHVIYCGNYVVEVTQNCVDALIHVRQKYGRVSIWVDALCIDQTNVQERNHQVGVMGEIYSHAHTVYIWLGNETAQTTNAIRLLRTAANKRLYLEGLSCVYSPDRLRLDVVGDFITSIAFPERTLLVRRKYAQLLLQRLGTFKLGLGDSKDIHTFLEQSWFKRGWTFQEAMLASNPVFLCGRQTLSWASLVSAVIWVCSDQPVEVSSVCFPMKALFQIWMAIDRPVQWNDKIIRISFNHSSSFETYQHEFELLYKKYAALRSLQYPIDLFVALVRLPGHWHKYRAIHWEQLIPKLSRTPSPTVWSTDIQAGTDNLQFNGIVRALRERSVGNAKDKSYALYGVLQSLGVELHDPDYNKTKAQIYKELFLDLLKWTPHALSLIVDAGLPADDNSPSWIPHWDYSSEARWVPDHYVYFRDYGRAVPIWEAKHPRNLDSKTRHIFVPPTISFNDDETSLSVDAEKIDRVAHVVSFAKIATVDATHILLTFIATFQALNTHFNLQSQFFFSLYVILTMDELEASRMRSFTFHDMTVETSRGWYKWYEIMTGQPNLDFRTIHDETSDRYLWTDSPPQDAEQVLEDILLDEHASIFNLQVCTSLFNKRVLFMTENGRMGTGPLSTIVGDYIHTISGTPTPLLFRRPRLAGLEEVDVFQLVGPALLKPMWYTGVDLPGCTKIIIV